MVDARRGGVRAVHDHARQHRRERRAARRSSATSASACPSSSGSSSGYALTLRGPDADRRQARRRATGAGSSSSSGIAIFTLASLACGLAASGDTLIAARVAQGVGAALMNPATLSIITVTFPPRQRGTAIGIWAGVSALALAIGPLDRRPAHRAHRAGTGSSSSTSRSASSGSRRASSSSTSRGTRPHEQARPARPRHLRRSALFALDYGADRGEQLRLGLAADRRRLRRRRGLAHGLRPARAPPAGCRCST